MKKCLLIKHSLKPYGGLFNIKNFAISLSSKKEALVSFNSSNMQKQFSFKTQNNTSMNTVFNNRKQLSSSKADFYKFLLNNKKQFCTKKENTEKIDNNIEKTEENSKEDKEDKEDKEREENEDESNQTKFKFSRKIRFILRKLIRMGSSLGFILFLYQVYLVKKEIKNSENKPEKDLLYVAPLFGLAKWIGEMRDMFYHSFTSPYYHILIPDRPYGSPKQKVLVLNLNKTLVSYKFKLGTGFEIMKRPGLNKFLIEMGNYYEVVVFGDEDSAFVDDICSKLDPNEMIIKHKLGREATAFKLGHYIKDLRFLNRDLKDTIIIDFDPKSVQNTPENAIFLPPFNGDVNDKELLTLIQFLKDIAKTDCDVREQLEKYGHYRTQINYYKSFPKYKKLIPKDDR